MNKARNAVKRFGAYFIGLSIGMAIFVIAWTPFIDAIGGGAGDWISLILFLGFLWAWNNLATPKIVRALTGR